jgi:hypothetical protein
MAFSAFAQTAIDSALVCAVTMKEDRSMSDPFLMIIGAPTAVCRGHTRSKLWTGQPPHVLQPEGITGPKDVVFPPLGTTSPDSRDLSITMENRTPSYYLQEHEKVCFSENGWLYKLVMAPSTTDPRTRDNLTCGHPGLMPKMWYTYERAIAINVTGLSLIPINNPEANDSCALLPTMLPLLKAWDIPIGPLCDAKIGATGLRQKALRKMSLHTGWTIRS